MTDDNATEIRHAAMNLLARREHSRRELYDKLSRRFGDSPLIEGVLDALKEDRLQSDERFADSFIRTRAQRGIGPNRLRQELRQRGVDPDIVREGLGAEAVDWPTIARQVQRKKFGEQPPADARDKARRARFMYQRGFDIADLGW